MIDYVNFGQGLQTFLASGTMFWIVTFGIIFFVIVVMMNGFKKVANPGRLKWLLLHSLSFFLIGYFLNGVNLNKFLIILIFALGITSLSSFYRYFMFKVNDTMKNRGVWLIINLITLMVLNILYEVLAITDPVLLIFFSAFCLTLVGSLAHRDFKPINNKPKKKYKYPKPKK